MTARSSWRAAFRAISLSCTLMTELLGTSSPWKKWIPFRRSSWSASSLTAIRSNAIVMGTSGSRMALACRRGLPNLMPLPREVFSPSEIQAYPVPQGIRVIVYAKFDYEMDYAHTYSLQTLNTLLGGGRPAQSGTQRKHRWGAGAFSCRTLPGEGLHHGPMRAMAEAMGYTFSYNAVTGTAVCTKSGSAIEVSVDSTWPR